MDMDIPFADEVVEGREEDTAAAAAASEVEVVSDLTPRPTRRASNPFAEEGEEEVEDEDVEEVEDAEEDTAAAAAAAAATTTAAATTAIEEVLSEVVGDDSSPVVVPASLATPKATPATTANTATTATTATCRATNPFAEEFEGVEEVEEVEEVENSADADDPTDPTPTADPAPAEEAEEAAEVAEAVVRVGVGLRRSTSRSRSRRSRSTHMTPKTPTIPTVPSRRASDPSDLDSPFSADLQYPPPPAPIRTPVMRLSLALLLATTCIGHCYASADLIQHKTLVGERPPRRLQRMNNELTNPAFPLVRNLRETANPAQGIVGGAGEEESASVAGAARVVRAADVGASDNISPSELDALLALYTATNGPNWSWADLSAGRAEWNFTAGANPCAELWQGVSCGGCDDEQCVVYLQLPEFNLVGTLPAALANLTRLVFLDLDTNSLTGTLPAELGKSASLKYLSLNDNSLTGSLPPELGNLASLRYLYLTANSLTGSLPPELGNLASLQYLYLDDNSLTGTLPAELGNLSSLQYLFLTANSLTGTLPAELGNLASLRYLYLDDNSLTGSLPPELGNLASMRFLFLDDNSLTGTLPPELGNLANLQHLNLDSNSLTSSLPAELGNLANLAVLDLQANSFNGSLPPELGNLTSLLDLGLSYNSLTGTLPPQLGNLARLQRLSLDTNSLTGTLPVELGNLASLQSLSLTTNSLTGTLPAELGNLASLKYLLLDSNSLTGTLPPELGNLASLLYLSLGSNSLTGTLPPELGNLSSMQYLFLTTNSLTGTLPAELGNLASLRYLYLFNNSLVGAVPTTFSTLTSLEYLQVQNNLLSGSVQGVFDGENQKSLAVINLSNNAFTGEIPDEIFELPALQVFAAVSNCLSSSSQLLQSICHARDLITLSLDGMHTATECRASMLPGMPWGMSDAYTSATGSPSLPPCLLQMPNLTTLHLSGTGLTGEIPDVPISPTLLDLSLSHNMLSSSIPQTLQLREWTNLDLSYNRLRGELSDQFGNNSGNTPAFNHTLALVDNRLSGRVPSTLQAWTNIAVLEGNLFQCDPSRADLPQHDPDYAHFQCGSTDVEVPFFTWLALAGAALAVLVIVWLLGGELRTLFQQTLHVDELEFIADCAHKKYCASITEVPLVAPSHTPNVLMISWRLCRIGVVCALFAVLVLMPLYAANSSMYGTHEHAYMWTVAAVFTSGEVPVATELPAVVVLLVLILAAFRWRLDVASHDALQRRASSRSSSRSSSSRSSRNDATTTSSGAGSVAAIAALAGGALADSAMSVTSEAKEGGEEGVGKEEGKEGEEGEGGEEGEEEITIPLLRRLPWFAFLMVINVVVVLAVNTAFVYVLLYGNSNIKAFLQFALSLFKIVWNARISPFIARWVTCKIAGRDDPSPSTCEVKSDLFYLQLLLAVLNIIVIPCFTVAAIDPNCFNGIFHQASSVIAQYSYEECTHFDLINSGCFGYSLKTRTTVYQPPFIYSYQCGASLVTSYVPTFLYLCIIASLVEPLRQLCFSELLGRKLPGTRLHRCISWAVRRQLWPLVGKEAVMQGSVMRPYFDADTLLLKQLAYLFILVTFGAAFPPLAAALAMAMVATHHFERYTLGRFLRTAYEQRLFRYIQIVEDESAAAGGIAALSQAKWMLMVVCALFFALLLFDTLGDNFDQHSYWILIVVPLLPACIYACQLLVPESLGRANTGAVCAETSEHAVEMMERSARKEVSEGGELDADRVDTAVQGGEEAYNVMHSKLQTLDV